MYDRFCVMWNNFVIIESVWLEDIICVIMFEFFYWFLLVILFYIMWIIDKLGCSSFLEMLCFSYLEMLYLDFGKFVGFLLDYGVDDVLNSFGDIGYVRIWLFEGDLGCGGFGFEVWLCGWMVGFDGLVDWVVGDLILGVWCGGFDFV